MSLFAVSSRRRSWIQRNDRRIDRHSTPTTCPLWPRGRAEVAKGMLDSQDAATPSEAMPVHHPSPQPASAVCVHDCARVAQRRPAHVALDSLWLPSRHSHQRTQRRVRLCAFGRDARRPPIHRLSARPRPATPQTEAFNEQRASVALFLADRSSSPEVPRGQP